jgi:hypothetical protein
MPAKSHEKAPPPEARFVFKGTVKTLQATTADNIPNAEQAAIVHVDEVIQSPQLLSKVGGRDITVYLGRKKLAEGAQAIFYTTGVHFGKSIAVEALEHHPVDQAPVTLAMHGRDPVKNLHARETQARMDSAECVCSGTVIAVRQPAAPPAAAATEPPVRRRPSEHDPAWQEAVVQCDQVYKGPADLDTVIVRFPNSRDIMWSDAPKFHVGQKGTFVLHRPPEGVAPTERPTTAAAATSEPPYVYTALHPMDFQPVVRAEFMRPLLAALAARTQEQ